MAFGDQLSIHYPLTIRNVNFKSRIFDSDVTSECFDLTDYVTNALDQEVRNKSADDLTAVELAEVVDLYGKAAAAACESYSIIGIVRGTTGTMIGSMLSPAMNHRNDEWGGPFSNRIRLAKQVLEKAREVLGEDRVLEFRMSGAEFITNGYTVEEGIRIARALESRVDIIHVTAGVDKEKDLFLHEQPKSGLLHGSNVRLAGEIKSCVECLVATNGGLGSERMMNEIIRSGKADIVYSGN